MDRISEIHHLLSQIIPLQSEKISIETKLIFDEENYLKTFDESKRDEVINGQQSLAEIENQLQPLQIRLRELQVKYLIQYKGKFFDPRNNTYYWETYVEELFLKNDCNINTFENSWESYTQIPNSSNLLEEVYHFLLMYRFSKFTILNIRKLNNN